MLFVETKLMGAYIIDPEKRKDSRGFFARIWGRGIFEERGSHWQGSSAKHFNITSGRFL